MNWIVPLSDLDYGSEEEQAVISVLRSKWLTMGEKTISFESEFGRISGSAFSFGVSNCTAALHMAIKALGIGPGDEVILPSLTFVATSNAVLYEGATPVFADITSLDLPLLDPLDVERKITPRTRAIIVMHYAGYPCDMPAFEAISRKYDIPIIEDAAHAPGAEIAGRKIGSWGAVSCFSFFSNKNLAIGEGGMICTDDADLAKRLRSIRSHGMTTITLDRHKGHAWSYDVVNTGYNYRLDEIRSALGLAQLEKLERNNLLRKRITEEITGMLAEDGRVGLPFLTHQGKSAYHILPILLPSGTNRESFMAGMKSHGIQTSIHYPPIHTFSNYKSYADTDLPVTREYAAREVTLPLYPSMSLDQIGLVATSVGQILSEL